MTIIGIAGCTGLMLTGFGIRDSVDDIPNAEFKEIFKYDATITLSNTDSLPEIEEYLQNNENIESYVTVCATTAKLSNGSKNMDDLACGVANIVNIFFPEVIALSGGVANQGDALLVPLRERVRAMSYGSRYAVRHTRIELCTLGYRAGVIGAALLAKQS